MQTIAPTLSSAGVDTIKRRTATADCTSDMDGTLYVVVVPDGDTAPTAEEVRDGTASGGGAAVFDGSASVTASSEGSISMTGLTPGTDYDCYFAAEDNFEILLDTPTKVDFKTLRIISVT